MVIAAQVAVVAFQLKVIQGDGVQPGGLAELYISIVSAQLGPEGVAAVVDVLVAMGPQGVKKGDGLYPVVQVVDGRVYVILNGFPLV